jgi:hypothetical protein
MPPRSSSVPFPENRKSQKVEAPWSLASAVPRRGTPEIYQSRLFRMQGQVVFRHSLAKDIHYALRIFKMLETYDEVITIPDKNRSSFQPAFHLGFEPFVQYVVQIDIPDHRRDDRPLDRSLIGTGEYIAVQHTYVQTFRDEPHKRLIRYPLLEHLQYLLTIDGIKEG